MVGKAILGRFSRAKPILQYPEPQSMTSGGLDMTQLSGSMRGDDRIVTEPYRIAGNFRRSNFLRFVFVHENFVELFTRVAAPRGNYFVLHVDVSHKCRQVIGGAARMFQ